MSEIAAMTERRTGRQQVQALLATPQLDADPDRDRVS